ncbi:MAG: NAD(P)/FAD-dependent oxidoreductase [Cytophagia bacterium]|nr:NAD(P)/FAD-dependent oxidoreductase [Cytophagia bacterium]
MIQTDVCIVGAGPVGLFAVFELGLLRLKSYVMDTLPVVGGQLAEIYPRKPIYDIPGYPSVLAGDLIDRLMEQIAPFQPGFGLGQKVVGLQPMEGGRWAVQSENGDTVLAGAVVIAGGLGCFEPRKPDLPGLAALEGRGVSYMVRDPEKFRGRRVVLAGGGDSALDWALQLADIAGELTLVHRNQAFRGAPESAARVQALADAGRIRLLTSTALISLGANSEGNLATVTVQGQGKEPFHLQADDLVPLYGLTPQLGPIAEWGLALEASAIQVNTENFQTSVPGIFAIGDINTYPGKLKLILSGFHEAALMAHGAYRYIHGGAKPSFKYTTVTGVAGL